MARTDHWFPDVFTLSDSVTATATFEEFGAQKGKKSFFSRMKPLNLLSKILRENAFDWNVFLLQPVSLLYPQEPAVVLQEHRGDAEKFTNRLTCMYDETCFVKVPHVVLGRWRSRKRGTGTCSSGLSKAKTSTSSPMLSSSSSPSVAAYSCTAFTCRSIKDVHWK